MSTTEQKVKLTVPPERPPEPDKDIVTLKAESLDVVVPTAIVLPPTWQERRLLFEALQPVVQRDADLVSVNKNPDSPEYKLHYVTVY